jgi:hypothetical protein
LRALVSNSRYVIDEHAVVDAVLRRTHAIRDA